MASNMKTALAVVAVSMTALLAGCSDSDAPEPDGSPWRLSENIDALRTASCPDELSFARAETIDFTAMPVTLGEALNPATHLPGAEFAGGWHLTSDDPAFGGLSGLDVFASGNLLAVGDRGAFVWITIEDGAPISAHMAPMRGEDDTPLEGPAMADAEGLTLHEGLAIVSFERTHRLAAFDLEGCGANARAAPIAPLAKRPSGMDRNMDDNGGAEGLAYSRQSDTLTLGIETNDRGQPLARLDAVGVADLMVRLQADSDLSLTGLDVMDYYPYGVFRNYQRGVGNTVEIAYFDGSATPAYSVATKVRLDPSVTVDNFEGIAVQDLPDGRRRAWIISDNNFNDSQRTLLLAFDLN